jgi:hypothetical protein
MTPERFGALAQAYGADLQRWPVEERDAAMALAHAGSPRIAAMLAEAAALDKVLDRYQVAPANAALTRRVLATVPRSILGFWYPDWWSGLSVAGVALGGVLAGAILVSSFSPVPEAATSLAEFSYAATAFGDTSILWSEE